MVSYKKILVIIISITLIGGTSVFAGKVIDSYKTPRGNFASIEQENIHKNRIGITVNGNPVASNTWYHDKEKTFVRLRDVAEMLGAEVNYNNQTMSADITLLNETNTDKIDQLEMLNEFYVMHDRIEDNLGIYLAYFDDQLALASYDFNTSNSTDYYRKRVDFLNKDIIRLYNGC